MAVCVGVVWVVAGGAVLFSVVVLKTEQISPYYYHQQ
jgi:hypothetical protein